MDRTRGTLDCAPFVGVEKHRVFAELELYKV